MMAKWICNICGYVYDEEKEGVPFDALPEGWVCPLCGAEKSAFSLEKPQAAAAPVTALPHTDLQALSPGALAALCSNLARGCEKQYRPEEAAQFQMLADFFTAAAPAPVDGSLDRLLALIEADLQEGYPALQSAARAQGDRGTQRICVWGEKVTRILDSLLRRYQREGEAFLQDTQVWVCSVCGFVYVGEEPPELCPVCKVPAWKFEAVEGRRA